MAKNTATSVAIGNIHFEDIFRKPNFLCTKYSVSVHLHQGYNVKRLCTSRTACPCTVGFNSKFKTRMRLFPLNTYLLQFCLFVFSATVTLLFEVTDLTHVSPALATRCGLIHCPEPLVGWKPIFRSWLKRAHARWEITNKGS